VIARGKSVKGREQRQDKKNKTQKKKKRDDKIDTGGPKAPAEGKRRNPEGKGDEASNRCRCKKKKKNTAKHQLEGEKRGVIKKQKKVDNLTMKTEYNSSKGEGGGKKQLTKISLRTQKIHLDLARTGRRI